MIYLIETLAQAYENEKHSLVGSQMFYYLRGVLVGYCITNQLDIPTYEAAYIPQIRVMAESL